MPNLESTWKPRKSKVKEKVQDTAAEMIVSLDGSVKVTYLDEENLFDLSVVGGGGSSGLAEQRDVLAVTAFNQTVFTLTKTSLQPMYSRLSVNGVVQSYGTGYTISGATLTYLPGTPAVPLEPTDEVIIIYR